MNLTLISAAIAAIAGFGSAWQIQNWRNLENENYRLTQAREIEREISRTESKRSLEYIDAQNRARQREGKLIADAAASKSAADSLRDTVNRNVQTARNDPSACAERAAALGVVFSQCVEGYSALASTADRQLSDLRTVIEAWPK